MQASLRGEGVWVLLEEASVRLELETDEECAEEVLDVLWSQTEVFPEWQRARLTFTKGRPLLVTFMRWEWEDDIVSRRGRGLENREDYVRRDDGPKCVCGRER